MCFCIVSRDGPIRLPKLKVAIDWATVADCEKPDAAMKTVLESQSKHVLAPVIVALEKILQGRTGEKIRESMQSEQDGIFCYCSMIITLNMLLDCLI